MSDWIPAPGNSVDLVPDGCEVQIRLTGVRRTSEEAAILLGSGDGGETGLGEHATHAYIEYPEGRGREVYYREAKA